VLSNLFHTMGHLVNFSTSWRAAIKGGHGERAEREPIRGSGGGASSGVQGQSPWSRGQGGEAPWSWNTFCFWMFNGNRKFALFLKFGNAKDHQTLLNFASWFHLTNHRIKTTIYVGRWRATWNPLAGRMRPAGRGLDSTGLVETT